VIGLPALKNPGRALASGLLLTAAAVTAAVAVPAASAAPLAPAAPASAAAPSGAVRAIAVDHPGTGTPPPGQVAFSAVGATPKGPNGRYEFIYTNIKPGSVIKDWVELFNRSAQSAAFGVYGVDATGTTLNGSLTYDSATQKPKDIGTWETFYGSTTQPNAVQASFVMGGGHGIIEPFTIKVPTTAPPGDHTGGVVVQVAVPTVNAKGERVTVYSRIALPVELRVVGPLHEGVQIQSISTSFNGTFNPFASGSATISYTVANTGNVRITGVPVVKADGIFGSDTVTAKLPQILPGDSVRVSTTVGGIYPAGPFTATVKVTPAWPKSAPLTSLPLPVVTDSASFFAVPWGLILLILALALLGFGTWRFLRWRARQRAAEMRAVATQARKDAERQMTAKAKSAATATAAASGAASATGDAAPDAPGEGE
jgi:hypothetical protein